MEWFAVLLAFAIVLIVSDRPMAPPVADPTPVDTGDVADESTIETSSSQDAQPDSAEDTEMLKKALPGTLAEMWSNYKQVCADGRIAPMTLFAIFRWETGNGSSKLFREANNPGGIKYFPQYPNLGHTSGSYASSGGIAYARFANRLAGAHGHFLFVTQSRYSKAWNQSVEQQIREIAKGGYAEDNEWPEGVVKLAKTMQAGGTYV